MTTGRHMGDSASMRPLRLMAKASLPCGIRFWRYPGINPRRVLAIILGRVGIAGWPKTTGTGPAHSMTGSATASPASPPGAGAGTPSASA